MAISRRRSLVRTSAIAAVAGSALLLPATAAFAEDSPSSGTSSQATTSEESSDESSQTDGSSATNESSETKENESSNESSESGAEQSETTEKLEITDKTVGAGATTYTLSSGDKAQLDIHDGEFRAVVSGGGAEGFVSSDGEKTFTSPTGVKFEVIIPATGKDQPWIVAEIGEQIIQLDFPADTDGQAEKPSGKPSESKPSNPATKPGKAAEKLKVTNKTVAKGKITYTLSSGDKAELSTPPNSEFSARLSARGAEGFIGANGETALTSPTGVQFRLIIPATGKDQPWILAEQGKQSIDLDFPTPTYGKADKGKADKNKGKKQTRKQTKVTPKGGVKAGADDVRSSGPDTTMLLAGGGAALAAAGLGFAALRHRRNSGDNA